MDVQRWEYLTISPERERDSLQRILEKRGNEGWELVSVVQYASHSPGKPVKTLMGHSQAFTATPGETHLVWTLYFKRPKS